MEVTHQRAAARCNGACLSREREAVHPRIVAIRANSPGSHVGPLRESPSRYLPKATPQKMKVPEA
jgi:hypothetical protein